MYVFAVFIPPFVPGAQEKNDAVFAAGNTLGVEVTIPALAKRCDLGNIDPQHSGGDITTASIEAAIGWPLPAEGATLFTVRADLDSVGAMAVLAMRLEAKISALEEINRLGVDGTPLAGADLDRWTPNEATLERVRLVGETDRFGTASWPGQAPLPSPEDRWPSLIGSLDSRRPTAVMQAVCLDARLPMERRVELVLAWLRTGEEPAEYVARVEAGRDEMIRAIASGEIRVRLAAEGRIAVVESRHQAALLVGYCHAPVVVAVNDQFRVGGSEPHTKVTVCQYGAGGSANLGAVFSALNVREFGDARPKSGWGGSPTIGGSAQGVSTSIPLGDVVEVVATNLL